MKVLDDKKAAEIKGKLGGNGKGNGKRVGLEDLDLMAATPEKEEQERADALERKLYAEKAGKTIIAVRFRVQQLKGIQENGILSLAQEEELGRKEKAEQAILLGCDEVLKKHVVLRVFIEELAAAKRERSIVKSLLAQAVKSGWYRLAKEAEKDEYRAGRSRPEGTVKGFNGDMYLLNPVMSKVFSDELAAALIAAVQETRAAEDAFERGEMARIRTMGIHDLLKLKSGTAGDYVIEFAGGSRSLGGVGVLSMCQHEVVKDSPIWVIKIIDGAGSLGWFRENRGEFIPFTWYLRGVPEKISGESRVLPDLLIKTIDDAVEAFTEKKD